MKPALLDETERISLLAVEVGDVLLACLVL